MAELIFPTLAGLKWDRTRTPEWSTKVQRTASGKEARVSFFSSPIWNYKLEFEFLRTDAAIDELKELVYLFNACQGSYGTFLFRDPYSNLTTDTEIGIADGSTSTFPLLADNFGTVETITGGVDPINSLDSIASVTLISDITSFTNTRFYIDGVENWYVDLGDSTVTFLGPIEPGAVISWTGNYFYRCRFKSDQMELNNFMLNLWEAKKVEFVSVK